MTKRMGYHMGDSDIHMLTFDLLKLHNYVLHKKKIVHTKKNLKYDKNLETYSIWIV